MIAFDIFLNGEKVCRAGVGSDYGLLTAIFSWTKRDLGRLPAEVRSELPAEDLKMVINGQRNRGENGVENLQWQGRDLHPGDDIHIRIVDVDHADAPETVKKIRPKFVQKKPSDILLH
jgi:hypothetical protein